MGRKRYLSKDAGFTSFVLGDFVNRGFSAVFAFAVGIRAGLWNGDCNYMLVIFKEQHMNGKCIPMENVTRSTMPNQRHKFGLVGFVVRDIKF